MEIWKRWEIFFPVIFHILIFNQFCSISHEQRIIDSNYSLPTPQHHSLDILWHVTWQSFSRAETWPEIGSQSNGKDNPISNRRNSKVKFVWKWGLREHYSINIRKQNLYLNLITCELNYGLFYLIVRSKSRTLSWKSSWKVSTFILKHFFENSWISKKFRLWSITSKLCSSPLIVFFLLSDIQNDKSRSCFYTTKIRIILF